MTTHDELERLRERLDEAGKRYNAAIKDCTEGYEDKGWDAASDHGDEAVAVARDAIALCERLASGQQQWRPISEAPGQGVVLVGRAGELPRVASWDGEACWDMAEGQGGVVPYMPTHWQELPPPPEEKGT